MAGWLAMNSELQHRPQSVLGRDELNLIDFPLGTLQSRQPKDADGNPVTTLVYEVDRYDEDLKQLVPKKLTIRTASVFGLPTPAEEELLIGLLLLTRIKNQFREPRVEFRLGELFQLMNWPHTGQSRKQLERGLDRLQAVTMRFENSWKNADGGSYEKTFATSLLDSYALTRQKGADRDDSLSWFVWAAKVFTDICSGSVRELNTDVYFALNSPISRRMYRFLDQRLSQSPELRMDLITFATHIGLSEREHVGKIKARLEKAIEELERIPNFIEPMDKSARYEKVRAKQWLIHFCRAEPKPTNRRLPRNRPRGEKPHDKHHPNSVAAPRCNGTLPDHNRCDSVTEITDRERLVKAFHKDWNGAEHYRCTRNELDIANGLIAQYGAEPLQEKLPALVKRLRREYPNARLFSATQTYWHDVMKKRTKVASSAPNYSDTAVDEQRRRQRAADNARWESLSNEQQLAIVESVAKHHESEFIRRLATSGNLNDPGLRIACITEMKRRQ